MGREADAELSSPRVTHRPPHPFRASTTNATSADDAREDDDDKHVVARQPPHTRKSLKNFRKGMPILYLFPFSSHIT